MKVLISACLMGQKVRYDGGDCFYEDPWLRRMEERGLLLPLCPEVEAGMSIPRPPIELRDGEIVDRKGTVLTESFRPVLRRLDSLLTREEVVLAILKERSPSCGVNEVYDGTFSGKIMPGSGLVASFLAEKIPVFSENQLAMAVKAYESAVSGSN